MIESNFKTELIKDLKALFPGCIIMHLDPNEIQGIPDILILYKNHWATLEGKRSVHERHRPNQDHYVKLMNEMSFSAFIYPENKESVIRRMYIFFNK